MNNICDNTKKGIVAGKAMRQWLTANRDKEDKLRLSPLAATRQFADICYQFLIPADFKAVSAYAFGQFAGLYFIAHDELNKHNATIYIVETDDAAAFKLRFDGQDGFRDVSHTRKAEAVEFARYVDKTNFVFDSGLKAWVEA